MFSFNDQPSHFFHRCFVVLDENHLKPYPINLNIVLMLICEKSGLFWGGVVSVYGLLTKEIKNYASNSDSQWVRLLDEHVKAFDKLLSQIPSEYLWRYQSSELLQQELKKLLKKAKKNENFLGCNQLIWGDTWETIHGAKTLQIRRLEHLTCGAITMLSQKNFLAFAILSRSVLEVAMWNVYHSVVLEKSVAELVNIPSEALINNGHMEELLTKLIWGSNQQHTLEELKQLKVLKVFKTQSDKKAHS